MNNPFFSKRQCVYAKNGLVATSEGLAAQAGLDILKKGGNAIDAAIATAAALTVVEPTSNGIGSDCFALVYKDNKLHGMNSSGYSSKNISIEKMKERGFKEMPVTGIESITVPGTPKGWARLNEKFGKLSLYECLLPAIKLAKEGFLISETVGYYFERAIKTYQKRNKGNCYDHFYRVFTKDGVSYKAGDLFKSDYHAETLELIGKTNADAFYKGKLADKICRFMEKHNGFIDKDDLAEYDVDFVEPIATTYRNHQICEIPPNGQGITALMALNLLNNETYQQQDVITVHQQIEAIKIAFSDTLTYVTDPKFMSMSKDYLLSNAYVKKRQPLIGETAKQYKPIEYDSAGTVYLATADKDGNMVSFIQSNYMGFGSGIVIDDTGIAMQNRGHTFKLDNAHHNCLMPRKRTYHTIIPGFIMKDNQPVGPFGVMGGFMQPQGHLQVIMNMLDFNMDPQSALDAPRFRWDKGLEVALENSFSKETIQALQSRNHQVKVEIRGSGFGRGQIIQKTKDGYIAGTETRCDGTIAYY